MSDKKIHLISIIIIVLFASSTIWWMNHSYQHDIAAEHYVQHVKDYPLLDPALPFYDRKKLVVNVEELRQYLKSLPQQNQDWADMSIYFEVADTGASISVNPDTKVLPASLMKLPAAMVALKKVEKGDWSLDQEFEITKENVDNDPNVSVTKQIGESFTLEYLLEQMLLESDNTSYWTISRALTDEEKFSLPEDVGLDEDFNENKKISAKDYTRMLRAAYSATYLSLEHSQYLLDLLAKSSYKDFLKAGIPTNIAFAHKWGSNDINNTYSDSGIVYLPNRTYFLSVMIQGKNSDHAADKIKANALMKQIAERTQTFMAEE